MKETDKRLRETNEKLKELIERQNKTDEQRDLGQRIFQLYNAQLWIRITGKSFGRD